MCGTLAKDQNRCILTRKKHYNALSRTVDQGNCLAVKEDLPADQVNEVFSFFKGTNIDLVYILSVQYTEIYSQSFLAKIS